MYDVIVIGSGGAGLSAALTAACTGAQVLVLEASSRWGGSTAVSAGEVWAPVNHTMPEVGVIDSEEAALRYCLPDTHNGQQILVEKFVRTAAEMARFVEGNSPITWQTMSSPDSFAERPGGRKSARHLEVSPLDASEFEPLQDHFWLPSFPAVFTNDEVFELRLLFGGQAPDGFAERRLAQSHVCTGVGLVAGLLQGARDHGVEFERNVRVQQLLQSDDQRIRGVIAEHNGATKSYAARLGVVIATGGFEWNDALRGKALSPPIRYPVSPPLHFGDGLRMAETVGAQLAHTQESWEWPVQVLPGQNWPGTDQPRHELVLAERCMPHVIWVDQAGQRFVNEASHNCALELSPSHVPVWAIADAQYRRHYPFAGSHPDDELPDHVVCEPELGALARSIGVDEGALRHTLRRYNAMVRNGRDEDFGRGESAYDRFYGDGSAAHPNLGSVEQPPFYAIRIYAGTVGTKGGACTDVNGRVLDLHGKPVAGLWAAGNAMASIIGPGTIAPGLTLGLALTWGYIAGKDAAQDAMQGG